MTYTTKEAAERLPEILERVKAGEQVLLMENGEQIAEIRPVNEHALEGLENSSEEAIIRELEELGILEPPTGPREELGPIAKRPGALARFLESRG